MKIIVNPHKLEIEKSPVNEKEINITKCEFEFSDIEQDLVKKAFFTLKDTTYEQIIVNGECDIPSEVLEEQGQIEIGVIAYQVEDEEYIKRYNPSPAYFTTWKGSLKEAENSSKPTPSQIEQIESEIATIQNDIIDLDNNKQDTLVSGENIKTINNESLLGSGDIDLNETYYTKGEVDSIKTTIEGEIPTKVSQLDNDSEYITKEVNNLTYYTLATNTGSIIELGINTSTYVMTLNLKNAAGTTISTQSIDLPLESVVVSGSYDSVNKSIILTLQSGSTITIPVGDLVSGLQSEITPSNKLSSDLVDDTGHTNKFVTASDKTNWNGKVSPTDYATGSIAGVVKTNSSYGVGTGSTGNIYAGERTYAQYQTDSNNLFISKGTLENVITGKELTNKTYVDAENATQDTQIEALQEENNYLNSIIDQLPKVSGEGEYITLNNTIEGKMSLELGSTELEQGADPSPTNPQQIHTISGDNQIVVQNKNLLKITSGTGYVFVNGLPYNTTSSIVVDNFNSNNITYHASTASYLEILTNVIQLKPNTEYTLNFDRTTTATNNQTFVYNYDNGTYSINYRDNNTNKSEITFTTSANGQIVLGFGYGNVTGTTTISNIQIELGSSKTTFVSHQQQVKEINLVNLEVCEIGDYKDEFYLATDSDTGLVSGKWYLKKNINKELIKFSSASLEVNGIRVSNIDLPIPINTYPTLYCNYFKMANNYNEAVNNGVNTPNRLNLNASANVLCNVSGYTTTTEYINLFTNNDIYVYYPVSTPTYTLLNDTLQEQINDIYYTMKSYKEQTNISQVNNDLGFTIKASALLDLNTLIG